MYAYTFFYITYTKFYIYILCVLNSRYRCIKYKEKFSDWLLRKSTLRTKCKASNIENFEISQSCDITISSKFRGGREDITRCY